ncbi:MAG TPA: aminotransferase class I/II-fold pyridoxal phosphate-dependent enzyme [Terriglobales bacterium]|nr:aminotransferase class I/II-fold pyridoxal phosphate-dependent enzyme [Terriglobales bacterium]
MPALTGFSAAIADLEARMTRELAALEAASRRRRLRPPAGEDFCSNDYLGLADHPALRQAAVRALAGGLALGGASARLVRGEHPAFAELEQAFAAFVGAEAALFFSSGYAANVGLIAALAGKGDLIFSDQLNHASLIDGVRLSGAERVRVAHNDLAAWQQAFAAHPPRAEQRRLAIVESVHGMEGDRAPLAALAELCARAEVALIVDEAHATGLCGPGGAGAVAADGVRGQVLATVHTCGKALGAAGALVAGSAVLRDYLINRARTFIYATAPPPWLARQVLEAMRLAASESWRRERVLELARQLRRRLRAAGLETGPDAEGSAIVPVILGADARALAVADALARAGYDARAIRPPTVPENTARLRVTLHANQTAAAVEGFAAALAAALRAPLAS